MTTASPANEVQLRPVSPAGILAARLAAVVERVDRLEAVDAALTSELRDISTLARGLDPYLGRCTSPASPTLQSLADRTRAYDWSVLDDGDSVYLGLEPEMLSGHVEGQLLQMLVHATRASHVLEIGMFTGYSALAMAEAMSDDGRLVACEINAKVAELARDFFRESAAGERIDVRVGPARDTLMALAAAGNQFDLVFIDADKVGYTDYFGLILDLKLLTPHGLICADNTLMQGEPWTGTRTRNGAAIARFNDIVAADSRVDQVVLPLRDGLTLIRVIAEQSVATRERPSVVECP